MTNTKSQCGCKIYRKIAYLESSIRYCSLHALAPRMFEFIKTIADMPAWATANLPKEARQIISEAEGLK